MSPREVVLWHWRGSCCWAISLAWPWARSSRCHPGADGTGLSALPRATRRQPLLVLDCASVLAWFCCSHAYFFHAGTFWAGIRQASFSDTRGQAFAMGGAIGSYVSQYQQVVPVISQLGLADSGQKCAGMEEVRSEQQNQSQDEATIQITRAAWRRVARGRAERPYIGTRMTKRELRAHGQGK